MVYMISGGVDSRASVRTVQLEESPLLQAILKVGDGVQESEVQDVPEQLRHKYAQVRCDAICTLFTCRVFHPSCAPHRS